MKKNPDDRRDNVDKIKNNIDNTIKNMELADEMIARSDDEKLKEALKEKNDRRGDALGSMKKEIRDEAIDKKRGYK